MPCLKRRSPELARKPAPFALPLLALWMALHPTYALQSEEALFDSEPYPHPESSLDYRVTNRRYVSHIVYETKGLRHFVTVIMTHPGVWAYHANSHALHHECGDAQSCLGVMRKLDDFLRSGWNIGLRLHGSEIKEIIFLEQR